MKRTDYSKIAHRYDRNIRRKNIEPDSSLKEYIKRRVQEEYCVLDLACGTGNYLAVQVQAFKDYPIKWFELDASEEMLQIAKEKVKNVEYFHGYAEDLPYEAEKFDFIANNYAFHHFENKHKALDEITRVLRKQGVLHMNNISPQYMKKWWIYQYFPQGYNEDQKRFWKDDKIFHEFKSRGFNVQIKVNYYLQRVELSEIFKQAKNRDISQLNIIPEKDYEQGTKRMEEDLNNDSNLRIVDEGGRLSCIAQKVK